MTQFAARVPLLLLGLLLTPAVVLAQPGPKPSEGKPKGKQADPSKQADPKKADPKADKAKADKAKADKAKADKAKADKKKKKKKKVGRKRPPHRPVLIKNARIEGRPRPVALMIAGGKIAAILPSAPRRAPRGTVVIDAKGGRVVPGRIDAWASIGGSHGLGNALDAFDPYDAHAIREALKNGVTTVYLNPSRGGGIAGTGAVIKLWPGWSAEDMLVREQVAVCSSLALSTDDPINALRELEGLAKTLKGVATYRDAWLDYEEALEKYIKALPKAKPTKKAGKTPPKKGKTPPKKGKTPPKKGKTPPKKGKTPPKRRRPMPRRPVRRAPSKPSAAKPGAKPGDKKKKKGPKKPKRPKVDRAKALLVKVLNREIPLRIEAHRVEDIVNLLELQTEFKFRLILEGATEAHLLAKVLAKRDIPVVLGQHRQPDAGGQRYPLAYRRDNAALLEAAGVEVVIGSDGWTMARNLETNAALAAEGGLSRASSEAAVTSRAAKLLGLEKVGQVKGGFFADLVILGNDPLGAEVPQAVLVEGHVVYRRTQ